MRKNSKFAGFYMGLIFFLMYLPIAIVIIFSFNESRLPVRLTGFSLKWYQELLQDNAMLEALVNSLILELSGKRSDRNAGSRRPVKDPLEVQGSTGIYIHFTADDPGNHSGHGVDGLFLFAGSSLWNVDFAHRTYGVLCALYFDGG